jgi:hypothetical protein
MGAKTKRRAAVLQSDIGAAPLRAFFGVGQPWWLSYFTTGSSMCEGISGVEYTRCVAGV